MSGDRNMYKIQEIRADVFKEHSCGGEKGMKRWSDRLVDMIFRGAIGLVVIYILEQLCLYGGVTVMAGINPGTFLLVAILGMPGFLLVFALSLIYLY